MKHNSKMNSDDQDLTSLGDWVKSIFWRLDIGILTLIPFIVGFSILILWPFLKDLLFDEPVPQIYTSIIRTCAFLIILSVGAIQIIRKEAITKGGIVRGKKAVIYGAFILLFGGGLTILGLIFALLGK